MKNLLMVFAKSPVKGEVKTRLGNEIEFEKSHWVYLQLLKKTAENISNNNQDIIVFQSKPNKKMESIFDNAKNFLVQNGSDLGNKMLSAFQWAFNEKYKNVILIGTDLWNINESMVIRARNVLENKDFVIGPTYDGGYYLIGMKKIKKKIFQNIPWSTNRVLEETLKKIKNDSVYFLGIENDIDDFIDLKNDSNLYNMYLEKFG